MNERGNEEEAGEFGNRKGGQKISVLSDCDKRAFLHKIRELANAASFVH